MRGSAQAVHEVREHVARQGEHRAQDQGAHDQGVVPGHDGLVEQKAQAGQGEDGLDDHAAADEQRHPQAQKGDHGQERVAQGVAEKHHALGKPLGPGREDVVLGA